MNNVKVLVITNNINSNSGWGRYSSLLLKEYPFYGIKYLAITEKSSNSSNEKSIIFSKNSFLNFIRNIINIRKEARYFDIVHAYDGWPYGVYGYLAVIGTNKSLFINGVGTYSVAPLYSFVKGFLLRMAYKRAGKIFCISNYTKNQINKLVSLNNLTTVLLGTPPLNSIKSKKKQLLQNKYELSDVYPLVLTVGQIKYRKGQLVSIKALALLKNKYPNFKYVMIGDSSDVYYIEQIKEYSKLEGISGNILIISDADDEVLSFFYEKCNVFMLVSQNTAHHFEGFGLVLLEAAQFGKPVIGSYGCGIEDAIQDGYNGYLVNPKDVNDIYHKLTMLLDENSQISYSINAISFAKQFNWRDAVKEYYINYKKHYDDKKYSLES